MTVAPGVPASPADARQALQIRGQGTPGSPFIFRDASLGLRDLSLQFRNGLFSLAGLFGARHFTDGEPRNLQCFQGLAVSLELRPVPGDFAIGVSNHVEFP